MQTCFTRGFDGGKKIKGIKIHLAVDKYGFPLAITVSPGLWCINRGFGCRLGRV